MKLVLATRNPHKVDEIRQILAIPGLELAGLEATRDLPEIVEDGLTFAANAVKKAVTTAFYTKTWAMADDSGLEVTALNCAPGVHSARYAGDEADYAANNDKLLRALADKNDRTARFCCVIALADPSGRAQIVEGYCEGRIIQELRGANGFGYDPLFVPQGYSETFAEMDSELKNRISHRGRALDLVRRQWSGILGGECRGWELDV